MMPAPECYQCKHFNQEDSETRVCAAFPAGIPDQIFYGIRKSQNIEDLYERTLHHQPLPELGQANELVFTPA